MTGDSIQACKSSSVTPPSGPYRFPPPVDPELCARIHEALNAARSEMRRARRTHRWSTWLAVSGYIAAAILTIPFSEDDAGAPCAVVWPPVAVGATCALARAGRAGARLYDLEGEIENLERLSSALARTPV